MYSTDVEHDGESDGHVNLEARLRERRPTAVNIDELLSMMQGTRNVRRAWITTQHPTITEIFQRYPRLMDMPDAVCINRFFIVYVQGWKKIMIFFKKISFLI